VRTFVAVILFVALGVGLTQRGGAVGPVRGVDVFMTNCSTCHGADGRGMSGAVPPLARNPVVVGDPRRIIHIVKNGLTGRVSVDGANYDGRMPAWKSVLDARQVAAVITYIRSSWGNRASAVTVAAVNAQK